MYIYIYKLCIVTREYVLAQASCANSEVEVIMCTGVRPQLQHTWSVYSLVYLFGGHLP